MLRPRNFRNVLGATLVALTVAVAAAPLSTSADARAGGGFSFGSRGSRSFSMPSATDTAPRSAQPFSRPYSAPGIGQPRRFGFGSGLLAGLLGASLLGGGFMGGVGGLFSLLFNLALIGGAIWLVLRLFRGRNPQPAGAGAGFGRAAFSPLPGAAAAPQTTPASVGPEDYAAFETNLRAVQDAFSREDRAALSRLATPGVASTLGAELDDNRRRGVRNEVTGTRLLAGDLSEAWREGSATFATVAMRFAAFDVMRNLATGRIESGDPDHPAEATELWTFVRSGSAPWQLSAIQQAA